MNPTRHFVAMLLASVALANPAFADELADGFKNPPQSARPRVWWHWMNGNVTVDGITKDLSWMERVGIGGLQNFDANLRTPQIVEKRLVYMDDGWKAAFRHAVETAEAKGLEFAIAASPGWSETGGPWVKPADGMKKLVWSETVVPGGKRFTGRIAPAPDVTGPYQSVSHVDFLAMMEGGKPPEPPRASGDVAVIAVPTVAALAAPQIMTVDGKAVDGAALADTDPESGIDVQIGAPDAPGGLVISFAGPVTVRSLRLHIPHAKPPFGSPAHRPLLEAELDGRWQKLGDIPLGEAATTISFPAVTAQRYRVLIQPNGGDMPSGLGGGAPGAESWDVFAQGKPKSVKIGELRLSGDARVNAAESKAGFDIVNNFHALADAGTMPGLGADKVIDLSALVKPDGSLDWKAPKGSDWRIYRFGWSLTGKTNHPAPPEATGLEVDKYDAAAVRRYLETYLGMYRDTVGADLIGRKGIRALLTDSIEVGPSNWTPRMFDEFKARRGYNLKPWLPALAGEVIGSPAESEKFLFDFRTTLADLLADAHYGTVAKVAHENGMTVYGEALENGRPVLGDDLALRAHADVPMAALWTWGKGEQPRATLIGDMKGAASVAHVYGQNIVAAESMTAANSPWAFAPRDLKHIIDLEFASGINRPVIHTSVHQPVDDKKPGLSLMIFGQYFNRHDTWAEMAKPWVDYISRTGFMLQQGRNHADIAYFYGEESPVTGLFEFDVPKGLPTRYAYDFVNADMLHHALAVEGGEIVAKGGARYKAIYLGGRSHRMTLGTLRQLAAMVGDGALLIGRKPEGSPSLKDDPTAFATLADQLWGNPRVIASSDVEAALEKAGVGPDFHFAKPKADSEILFVHRKLADGDSYFINNRQDRDEMIEARFRVTGKKPEIWNAVDGSVSPASYRIEDGGTMVRLALKAHDSVFVVFREATGQAGQVLADIPDRPPVALNASWTVSFQPGRGAPASITLPALKPLNEHADTGVKYFSGVATYATDFKLPKGSTTDAPLWLDLGQVGDIAEVRVNGQMAGTLWFAPNRIDIGKWVKPGRNRLDVRVANVWVNRLIGDKQPGAAKVTFTATLTYKPDAPLRPSGLIGPVQLQVGGSR